MRARQPQAAKPQRGGGAFKFTRGNPAEGFRDAIALIQGDMRWILALYMDPLPTFSKKRLPSGQERMIRK